MPLFSETSLAWSVNILLLCAAPLAGQSDSAYAGAQACAKCHLTIDREAAVSRHARMMQPATARSVEGNFAQGEVVLHGSKYLLKESGGKYSITESDLTGKSWEHPIEYTLGVRRVQHYITTLPGGRMILIPAAWDNSAKKWVHDVDLANPEEASGDRILIWNKTCYGCHVTGEQKNYDPQRAQYHTTWVDLGVSCESCHGPGKEHAAHPNAKAPIVNPAHLDAARSVAVCAQCHSIRNIYADGFMAGADYPDYFVPVMEYGPAAPDDPAYWPDGRPRWFSNEAAGLWQSSCFLQGGATCVTCHSQPHNMDVERNAQLRPANNALCAQCHRAIAANVAAHSHHAPASAGSSCVGCHMPPSVMGLKAQFHDHSMSIPVPENTVRHGIPNACNQCHRDRDAAWAARQVTAWYGAQSGRKMMARADAFAGARERNPAAIPALLEMASDAPAGAWVRANAMGYLGAFPDDPSAYNAVLRAFSDADPLVRATAASAIRPSAGQRPAVAAALIELLKDRARTVRMSAAIALVSMGVQPLPGEDGARYEQAKQLYRERAALFSDDAEQQFAAGRFFLMAGDLDGAAAAFRASLKLQPSTAAQYLLARALAAKNEFGEARQLLQTIPASDPAYGPAQSLLAEIEAKAPGLDAQPKGAPAANSDAGHAQFLAGQVQFDKNFFQAALNDFEEALRLGPQADWALKARIYRAICLEKLSRASEAEAAMQTLLADAAARQDLDLQLAFVELLFETGRFEEAGKRMDEVIAAAPDSALAYFWRAKTLLQLQRVAEAAGAAEESIRLAPQLPQAHNLLIRIYQMQGRAKEAAQQAEWLREYERRNSH